MSTTTRPPETNSGVITSWLPISTAWPAASQCSTEIYSQLGNGGVAIAFDPFYGMYINSQITCLPPDASSWWNQAQQTPAQTVTSIGPLVCPELYTTGHTSVLNSLSTFVACCPSEYTFQSVAGPGTIGQCNSPLTSGQEFTYQSDVSNGWFQTTTKITANAGASVYAVHLNGYIFGTTSSSPTAITTSASSTSPTGTTSSTSTSATSSPTSGASSGLSSGAKAGIGVGVTIGAIGILSLIAAWFLIRRHRRKAEYTTELARDTGPLPPKDSSIGGGYSPVAHTPPMELPVQNSRPMVAPVELSGEPM